MRSSTLTNTFSHELAFEISSLLGKVAPSPVLLN